MKIRLFKIAVIKVCCLLLMFSSGFLSHGAQAQPITLSYVTNTGPTGLRGMAEKMFIDEIGKLGKGKVTVRVYWEQSFLKDKEILEGVMDGTADIGHININYYPARLLKNGVITLLQRGPSRYANRMWVYETMYREIPELTEEIDKYKQKIIYTYSVMPLAGCFTKPITSLKDYKDRRVRTASRWMLKILGGTGAIPVSIPWVDCYMALKTNALEGVHTNIDGIHRARLDEVAPHLIVFRELWNPVPFHVTINRSKWNTLPGDVQKIIEAAAVTSRKQFAVRYENMLEKIVSDQRKAGHTVSFAKPEDIERWMSLKEIESVKAQWIKEVNQASGNEDARKILDKVEQIVAEGIKRD